MMMSKNLGKKPGRPAAHPRAGSGAGVTMPWSVPLDVDAIPEEGMHRDIVADEATCAAVAALAEVRAVSNLTAAFDINRAGDIVHVTGRVHGRVGQNCVVTLEPMETEVEEAIDLLFAPGPEGDTPAGEDRRRKTTAEPPEPLVDGKVDLGAIATEFLILGIDPYPRKPGVEFVPIEAEDDDAPHPFAALERLKKPSDGGES